MCLQCAEEGLRYQIDLCVECRDQTPTSGALVHKRAHALARFNYVLHDYMKKAVYEDALEALDRVKRIATRLEAFSLESPITPKTPGTQFPITPTSSTMGMEGMSFGYDGKDRELDPTTLFVGGLEMHGPSAWDEERVANLFAKYGGLQSVKVVRPRACRQAAKIFVDADIPSSELPGRFRLRQVQQ